MQKYLLIALIVFSLGFMACDDTSEKTNNTNNINNTNSSNNTNNDAGTDADSGDGGDASVTECDAPPRDFWNYDLTVMPPRNVQIPSTCRGMGPNVYVYVADEAWDEALVDEQTIENIVNSWETRTAGNSEQGIYSIVTSAFGNPPDVDDNPRVIILISKLGSYNGHTFDGYFRMENQSPGSTSNLTEMLYIDCEHHSPDSDYLLGVMAHEFQHLISFGLDPMEEDWLDETMSQGAMYLTGYHSDLGYGNSWLSMRFSSSPLIVSDARNFDYGAGFIFAAYFHHRLGTTGFSDLAAASEHGIDGLDSVISASLGISFWDFMLEFGIAALVNDPLIEGGKYSFSTIGEDLSFPDYTDATSGQTLNLNTLPGVMHILKYEVNGTPEFTVNADSSTLKLAAVHMGNQTGATVEIIDISSQNASYTAPQTAGNVYFIILQTGSSETVSLTVE
ncbi:hypothetical protein KKF34_13620 [Myxococcota bacterium]|nr:hypothetical protein [Myxococcota bacterium]MBU1379494.1 hypothetical protein [Myxococcota bacterium]MBU1497909.1 hypothetical protein [Myxococcota bacterium]